MAIKFLVIVFLFAGYIFSQPYPDQFYSYKNEALIQKAAAFNGTEISSDGKSIILSKGITEGDVTFGPDSSGYPFNRGLPSWNGNAPNDSSSFKVLMRFYDAKSGYGWSSWLTVGYWKANIWNSYGSTSFFGGKIDIDNAVLNSYFSKWQFKVILKRINSEQPSPGIHKLSFFVSDQKTTDNINLTSVINDKPGNIFIPTDFFYQYSIDPDIGGDICSPTSVSMILHSFNIKVDPLKFARDTYCTYWQMFGIWPRVVQNASGYGLDGAVTRYRSWSEAYKVLSEGGRIAMSVGSPLYSGHLIMLAGFDDAGNPIVHDPAKSNGYGYKFNKTLLSESWFEKGGVAYTFFPEDTNGISSAKEIASANKNETYLLNNYPNPFNPVTRIRFGISEHSFVSLKIYDILGKEIATLVNEEKLPGNYEVEFNSSGLPTGVYFYSIFITESGSKSYRVNKKMIYLK